jgi:hypothetical protein
MRFRWDNTPGFIPGRLARQKVVETAKAKKQVSVRTMAMLTVSVGTKSPL